MTGGWDLVMRVGDRSWDLVMRMGDRVGFSHESG